jgi:threonine dehydrogenase-like Zn-dependent dehydrogenase
MKAPVFHAVGDIRLDEVPDPPLQAPTDAIVHLTSSVICGTDLHFVRGTMAGIMKEGTTLGHEGVGVVEEPGDDVRNLDVGDRVVICSTIACGACSYCRAGHFAQCDNGPTRMAPRPGPRSSAAPNRPARSTACRRSGRGSPSPTRRW